MGKKLRDEDLVLNIIVNGDKGKKEIHELERAVKDTTLSLKSLEAEEKKLRAEGKKDTQQYREVTAAIIKQNAALDIAKSRMSDLRSGLKLTAMSHGDLRREIKRLTRLRNVSGPSSANWKKYNAELLRVQAQMDKVKAKAVTTGASLKGMANGFNRFLGSITAAVATFAAMAFGVKNVTDKFAGFDDKIADVQKTTGLLREDVIETNEVLKNYDTRTAQLELLGLERVAGKLGHKSKEDILGFVRAADQIGVGLSEDLGGDVEQAITDIGKLVGIFNVSDDFGLENALLKVGSAINEVGANSEAQEAYLVDFTKRLGGIAPIAKISIANIIGIGATLDQFGQSVEKSGTAVDQIISLMFKNTADFARIAGVEVSDFSNLLETDANEAFLTLLDGLKGNEDGMSEVVKKLGELGIEGTRARGVISVLANKTKELRDQQDLANKAFEEGTSLTDEFNIKNNTAAARLEKAQKEVYNLSVELGERLMPVVEGSTNLFASLLGILVKVVDFFIEYKAEIFGVATAIVAYNVALKAQVLWTKRADLITKILNTTLLKNPWVLVGAAIVAVIAYFALYRKELTAVEKSQNILNDAQNEANSQILSEKTRIQELVKISKNKLLADNTRIEAIKELNRISPEYLGNLKLETINTEEATLATDDYIKSKLRRIKSDKLLDELVKNAEPISVLEAERDGLLAIGRIKTEQYSSYLNRLQNIEELNHKIEKANIVQSKIQSEYNALIKEELALRKSKTQPITGKTDAEIAAELAKAEAEALAEKLAADKKFLTEKELSQQAKFAEARRKAILESKSLIDQEKAAFQDRLKETDLFEKQVSDLKGEKLTAYEALLLQHKANITKIETDAIVDEISRREDEYKNEVDLLHIQQNEQLQVFEGTKEERKHLLEKHSIEEAQLMERQAQDLMAILQEVLSGEQWEGITADQVLSDEEKAAIESKINELNLLLSSLGVKSGQDPDKPKLDAEEKVDIFGMTQDDWTNLGTNIESKQKLIAGLQDLANGLVDIWASYNDLVSAKENAQLQEFESNSNKKKEVLDNQLKRGAISQEAYNTRVEKLDKELDKKKAQVAYDQAKRQKGVSLLSAIVNTSAGVARAFSDYPWPYSMIPAAIVGAAGTLQISAIAKEPLPEIPGREDGGYIDVRRSQDQRLFRAKNQPNKRGFVNSPTVITGEGGEEFIANNAAANNPSVRPVLDAIDTAQRNGSISTMNLMDVLGARPPIRVSGRESGGYIYDDPIPSDYSSSNPDIGDSSEMYAELVSINKKLVGILSKPIKAETVLLGRNGFYEKQEELAAIDENVNL